MKFLEWLFKKKDKKTEAALTVVSPKAKAEAAKQEEFERVFRSDMDRATAMAYCREAAELRMKSSAVNLARVEGIYRAVVEACPDFWMGHFGLGEVLTTVHRRSRGEALESLRRAMQLAPQRREPLFELARELLDQHPHTKFDEASAYYTEAIRHPPGIEEEWLYPISLQAGVHWEVAIAAAKKGQETLAIEVFQRAIELNPKYYTSVIRPESAPAVDCWRRAVQEYRRK